MNPEISVDVDAIANHINFDFVRKKERIYSVGLSRNTVDFFAHHVLGNDEIVWDGRMHTGLVSRIHNKGSDENREDIFDILGQRFQQAFWHARGHREVQANIELSQRDLDALRHVFNAYVARNQHIKLRGQAGAYNKDLQRSFKNARNMTSPSFSGRMTSRISGIFKRT